MKQKHKVSLSLITSIFLLPAIASADAFVTLESINLMEDELSGIGEGKVISQKKIERVQAKDMKDIFKDEPSISVGGGARNAQRIYLRGIEGDNLDIRIDGAKQGGSLFQHAGDIGGIDPSLLKSVTISTIAGADSGSGALGGSIVLETVDAQDLLKKGQNLGAILRGGYYSVSDGYSAGASFFGKITDHSGFLFDISGVEQEDYKTGSGKDALNTAVKDRNYFFKYSLIDYKNQSLKVGATHNKNDGHYVFAGSGSDMGIPSSSQDTSHIITTRDTYTLDYRYNPASNLIDVKTNLYYNNRNLENKSNGMDVTSRNYGGNIKNNFRFSQGEFNHIFTVGFDYDTDDGITKISGGDKTNTSKTLGIFAQGSTIYNILTIDYGLRLDDYSIEYGPSNEITGNEVSPNIGAQLEIYEGLTLFTRYSESIKIGSIIPVQWLSNANTSTTFNGSVDGSLEPESSKQIEGGARYRYQGLLREGDNFNIGVSLFKTTISNLISKSPRGGPLINDIYNSTDEVISKGYELKTSWSKDTYKTSLSFIHANVENKEGEAILTRRIGASIGDTLIWDNTWRLNPQLELGYTLTSVSKLKDEIRRQGYILHDIQVEYTPSSLKDLTLNLSVNNIFDKEYYSQTSIAGGDGSLVEEAGRDIRLSFKYQF